MQQSTHCIEIWEDKTGTTFITPVKPISEFNRARAMSKRYKKKYGYKTIALFRIKFKPGYIPQKIEA